MAIQWNKLRSFNSSQHNAFEELVCQLANAELIDKRMKFIRIAAPDGGLESYVELEKGEIYGWQAKFFLNSFSTSQWQQIGDSFKEALKNYPTLTKYYICFPVEALLHKDLKGKIPLIESNFRRNLGKWST